MILALAITIGIQFTDKSKANADNLLLIRDSNYEKIYVFENSFKYASGGNQFQITCRVKYSYGHGTYDVTFSKVNGQWNYVAYGASNTSGSTVQYTAKGPVAGTMYVDVLNYCVNRYEQERKKAEEGKRQEEENKRRAEQEKINRFNALIAEGDKYYAAKDYENARKSYQQARQINGGKVDEYCNNLIKNGDNLFNQKLYDAAKDYYRKAAVMGNQSANDKLSELTDTKTYEFNGHKYKVFNKGMSWDQAKIYCESQGGHLVTITSFEEQQVIEKLLREDGNRNHYWLGAYRSKDGHEYKAGQRFTWITGEESNFSNFSPDQPDNYHNRENYLMIYRGSNFGEWNDITVDGTVDNYGNFGIRNFGLICEWEK